MNSQEDNGFELEALEPRILLSGDGLAPLAADAMLAAETPLDVDTVTLTVDPTEVIPSKASDPVLKDSDALFDGLKETPVVEHDATEFTPASKQAKTTEPAPVVATDPANSEGVDAEEAGERSRSR